MTIWKATACAHPNIAFIKYWGNTDDQLRLPVSGSISMNLDGLLTRTTVEFRDDQASDTALLGGKQLDAGAALDRITRHLDYARQLAGTTMRASVNSDSNFPTGAGIASSASAFAALSLAAAAALKLQLSEPQLSAYARLGSGSASRSVPGGFVEWYPAQTHEASFAETFAPVDYWELTDIVAIVSKAHKSTGSTEGHSIAATSPLQSARVATAPERLARCKQAILNRDFETFADVVELDSNVMHSVMMTGNPSLFYWQSTTLALMEAVRDLRRQGIAVCYTIDAGPNIHCICAPGAASKVAEYVAQFPGVLEFKQAGAGRAAYLEQ
ncbi:MAG: diphosphomevalonate decarboxylase [Anaerolineae bacterium]|nr:diphosphomevalonate decarboxylase [Anaerolineae bacterium]